MVGPGCWRVIHSVQLCTGAKTFFFVCLFIYFFALVNAAVLSLPFRSDAVSHSRTNESASWRNLRSVPGLHVKVSAESFPSFFLFPPPSISVPTSRLPSRHPSILPPLPPLAVCLVSLPPARHFLCVSPPPPYAMSKACQSKPGRQSCHYSLW